jgi:hypothetical protein
VDAVLQARVAVASPQDDLAVAHDSHGHPRRWRPAEFREERINLTRTLVRGLFGPRGGAKVRGKQQGQ